MKRPWLSTAAIVALVLGAVSVPFSADVEPAAAAGTEMQDSAFTLQNGAVATADSSASDGSTAVVANTGLGWNIQFRNADFSSLVSDQAYEVYARVKVAHTTTSPSGRAFSMGVYDLTAGQFVLPDRSVQASQTSNGVWADYRIGTFVPTASANTLGVYIANVDNAAQVSTIAVDSFSFRPYQPYDIEDSSFIRYNGASIVHEETAVDGSAARLVNGPGLSWDVQADVDGSKIEAGVPYTISATVKMERTDFLGSVGETFGVGVYDATAGVHLLPPHTYASPRDDENAKYDFVWPVTFTAPVTFDPTHVNRIFFSRVDNAAQFPAVLIDKVTLTRATVSEALPQSATAYPYQISPTTSPGVNDSTTVTFSVPGTQTVTVTIRNSAGAVVRTLLDAGSVTGEGSVFWDGLDAAGAPAANDVYEARVQYGSTVHAASIRAKDGVTLAEAANLHPEAQFPLGVWYEGARIPKNVADAASYADTTFADLAAAGANDVIISNFDVTRPAVTGAILDKAAEHGLSVVVNPRWWDVIYSDPVNSDEFAMQARVHAIVDQLKSKSAFAGYLLYDEPPHGNDQLRETVGKLKKLVETADPEHAVMVDLSGVHSADKYFSSIGLQAMTSDPYGALWGRAAGDFTDIGYPGLDYEVLLDFLHLQTKKDVTSSAPLWTILQAFGQPGWYRDPSDAEIRAMTYEAIGHGSKGFHYFMYQATNAWNGMIDIDGNHTARYDIVKQMFTELAALKPVIQNLTRVANAATATGGGGGSGAYPNADVTTHVDNATGDTYLVVVNHDVAADANVTITIDRDALGSVTSGITDVASGAAIPFVTSGSDIVVTDLPFTPGEGRILKLAKSTTVPELVGQDGAFTLHNDATKANVDTSASDGSTGVETVQSGGTGWNLSWDWDAQQLEPGVSYDLYATVKVRFAKDVLYDANDYPTMSRPTSDAFTIGVYDGTAGAPVTTAVTVNGSQLENQLWRTVKVGTFTPSQTATEFVYLASTGDATDYATIYLDRFTFVKTP